MTGTDEVHDHQARCVPHVAALHLVAVSPVGTQLPSDAAEQVARATSAILSEAAAAALAVGEAYSASLSLLLARQARLEHAAADAVASAREAAVDGNLAALRQTLQRFEALTSAMWTVQRECASSPSVIRAGV